MWDYGYECTNNEKMYLIGQCIILKYRVLYQNSFTIVT